MNLIITALKVLVGMVGGIGLFVGAVGVANVLLVSVRDRTQEIGVRRALGATRRGGPSSIRSNLYPRPLLSTSTALYITISSNSWSTADTPSGCSRPKPKLLSRDSDR